MMICAPACKPAKLPVVRLPAVDRHLAHAALEGGQLRHFLRDLHRELARGAKDQHLRRGAARTSTRSIAGIANAAVLPEPVCDCPTTSRPGQQHRDGLRLDRRGLLVADFFDGLEELGREAEFREKLFLHVRRTICGGAEGREGCLQIRRRPAARSQRFSSPFARLFTQSPAHGIG